MTHECPLCSVSGGVEAGSLLAFAPHARLAGRLCDALRKGEIEHSCNLSLVTIPGADRARRRHVAAILERHLSQVEQCLIRIGPGDLPHIFTAPDVETYARIVQTDWFDEALTHDQFSIYYQPIVDLVAGGAFAYECLIRFESDRVYNGGEIVGAATLRNDILKFDAYARAKAIRSAGGRKGPATKLFIASFPSAIYDPAPCLETTLDA